MSDMLHLHLRWKLSDNRPTVIRLPVLELWESKEDELRTTRYVSVHPEIVPY